MRKIRPVILVGGSGTRLWPMSRESFPKQFHAIFGEHSLFQETLLRCNEEFFLAPIVITCDEYRFIVEGQINDVGALVEKILIEPSKKDTAAAILLATCWIHNKFQDEAVMIMPADHVIGSPQKFLQDVKNSANLLDDDVIVLFGVKPDSPSTAYGYLEISNKPYVQSSEKTVKSCGKISQFIEKPNLQKAEQLVVDENIYWNSGIFLFRCSAMLSEYKRHLPNMYTAVQASLSTQSKDLNFARFSSNQWHNIGEVSIDYGLMEKSDLLIGYKASFDWTDLGSWDAIHDLSEKDDSRNTIAHGSFVLESENTFIRNDSSDMAIVAVGLHDAIIVASDDAILVANKNTLQSVKTAVKELSDLGMQQAHQHRTVFRPWGTYEVLTMGERFKVKKIKVNPGAKLSLQAHNHRSEHWTVVEGTGRVTVNSEIMILSENESTYIPIGAKHRLENQGKIPLVIIEVQTGSYLEEDDIIRFDDMYKRDKNG